MIQKKIKNHFLSFFQNRIVSFLGFNLVYLKVSQRGFHLKGVVFYFLFKGQNFPKILVSIQDLSYDASREVFVGYITHT
jgi:hypothetical protein